MKKMHIAFVAWLICIGSESFAHGSEKRSSGIAMKKEQTEWGIAGSAKGARTISIRMLDTMRFVPEQINVRQGETIRFVIANDGSMLHEFVIGTQETLAKHAELMMKFPNMEHSAPYMAHVGVGRKKNIVWTFNRTGTFDFACLIAGHYQAGMKGRITVAGNKKL